MKRIMRFNLIKYESSCEDSEERKMGEMKKNLKVALKWAFPSGGAMQAISAC